ncbi:MAG: TRAP transporter small permease [Thermodesulfobacteriota bacterium]
MEHTNQGFWSKLELVAKALSKLTGLIGALSLLGAALVTTEAVLVRKLLGWSTIWQIEFSVFLLMFSCFVGAAYGQLGRHHLNIDMLILHLKPRPREIVIAIADAATCVICLVVAYYAWPIWWEAVTRNDHSESLWGPPLWIPYLFLPLGLSLVFLQCLVQVYRKIEAIRLGQIEETVIPSELKDIIDEEPSPAKGKGAGHE